jgi:hypothetical protein
MEGTPVDEENSGTRSPLSNSAECARGWGHSDSARFHRFAALVDYRTGP